MAQRRRETPGHMDHPLSRRAIVIVLGFALTVAVSGCAQRRLRKADNDVHEIKRALLVYWLDYSRYPTGSVGAVCQLLIGKSIGGQNAKQLSYIEASRREINPAGEFIDPWGMPYRMIIQEEPFVYSAGPNKIDENGLGDDIPTR